MAEFAAALEAYRLALAGTLAAGHLTRRAVSLRAAMLPYLELTVPAAVTAGLVAAMSFAPVRAALGGGRTTPATALLLAGLAGSAGFMAVGAVQRWPAVPRLCLALTWVMLLAQTHGSLASWWLAAAAVVLTAGLLVWQQVASRRRLAVAG